jgi:hypothetical protein
MKRIFFMFLLSSAFALLGLNSAQAAPMCTNTNSIAQLIALGPCTDSSGMFTLTFLATTGSNRITPDSSIIVNLANGTSSLLDVQLLPTAAFNNDLESNNNSTAHYTFHYTVSFSPALSMTNGVINIFNPFVSQPNGGTVSGFKQFNSTFEIDTATDTGSTNGVTLTNSAALPNLPSPVVVTDDITLFSSAPSVTVSVGNGSPNPGDVENRLSFSPAVVATPEPLTMVLCSIGLLGLGVWRKILRP